MNPVSFPEQNCIYRRRDCMDLPACVIHNDRFETDEVVSCWELSDEEIVMMLKHINAGKRPKIFLSVIGRQPPVALWLRGE